ncbi:set-2 [Pristionchus pacificus]|uniref:[histone H3]-lysine(4) N-trimethyltransferase n=1 Tax=Pristionchus pacificus TaxID=54126 RepID=A0A2A6BQV4_PRIPA|nr:set-2 [Pristionchus pacificus]|eukprot:PDM68332.1 set-2 [Pristionchus pacificus]
MTSRNPHSDNSRPGPSWGQTDRKHQVQHLHYTEPPHSDRSFDGAKLRREQYQKPVIPEKKRSREAEIGRMVKYFEAGKAVKRREDMRNEFDNLRASLPVTKTKEFVEKKINKEVEESMVTVKIEETDWTEVKSLLDLLEDKDDMVVKKEIKMEQVKEVKKEVMIDGFKKLVTGSYAHHKKFRPSPTKEKTPSGPHPNEFTQNGYYLRLYKVVYDPTYMKTLKTKDFVRRYNGKCGEKYKQLDQAGAPTDPRTKYRRIVEKDLPIPNLIVDDQYTGIPPKREVTISNLNDNVNHDFLKKMASNHKLKPQEVHIFHHPETRKHLGMGLILFEKSKDARAFVDACDGQSVMGLAISCILDPFAAMLAAMHVKLTTLPLPPLGYLSGMSEHELSLRREKITGSAEAAAAPVEGAPAAAVEEEAQRDRSLSPMDTSNSPVYEGLPPPPPSAPPVPQQMYYDDAGTSSYKVVSPPPPYSELPPSNHGVFEERRSESHRRSLDPEGKPRRDKRRRASTSSSSSYSSTGEAHGSGGSSRHRTDGGVKKKREEYLKVKRYVSSERDSNGDKRILKEVKTVTYKRRTEQRTTIGEEKKRETPDSFDEEMKRRERSMSKGKRIAGEMRGKDDRLVRHRAEQRRNIDRTGWSTPSSDSDSGRGRGRKRAKEYTDDERRAPPPSDATPSTPLHSSISSCSATPSSASRRSGFHSAPIFDPTQPPPVIVPPVGLVLPATASRPSQHAPPPPPMMVLPPPPLPGGFIPPPEFFGIQSNAAMMCAASVAAGLAPPPPGMPPLPPPPPLPMMTPMTPMMGGGQTPSMMTPMYGGATPMAAYGSSVKKHPSTPYKSSSAMEEAVAAASSSSSSLSTLLSSPSMTSSSSGMARASSSSSLTAVGRSQGEKGMATPPTSSEGGSTPRAVTVAEKKEKANLDDRISQLFGLKKSKKEEDFKEMKHVASAPSISSLAAVEHQKSRDDDDMEIDDDDDMDVASSSSGERRGSMQMTTMRETKESEDERKRKEEAEIRRKEQMAEEITRECLGVLMMDLQQQIIRDLQRKLEATAWQVLGEWEKKQKNEGEEKKKQMIRDSLAAAAARQNSSPKKDPMEEMLAKKLMSPEGLSSGISKVFSAINIIKKKNITTDFSRDGTPMSSRDSRARSSTQSRSSSRSSSSSSVDSSSRRRDRSCESASTVDSDKNEEERGDTMRGRKEVRRRPNMRNIESSQEPSSDFSSDESDSDDREKENDSPDVDIMEVRDDEQKDIKEEEMDSDSSQEESAPSTSSAAVAARAAEEKVLKKEEEEEEAPPPPRVAPPPSVSAPMPQQQQQPISAADAARLAALLQAELLRQQPSMRPDAGGYDPIRYDHPYVRQLGVPVLNTRPTVYHHQQYRVPAVPNAAAAAARTAKAAADAAAACSLAQPLYPAASAAAGPAVQLKPAKKKIEGARVPHALLGLLPYDEPKKPKKERKQKSLQPMRTEEEELRIRDSFKCGMDAEDEKFLALALAELQLNGARPFGVPREIEFESRMRAYTPKELTKPGKAGRVDLYFEDKDLAGIVPHSTGCARTEGFYRLSQKQKIRIMRRPEAFQDRTEINERDEVVTRHQVQAQKEQRSMNRRLQTMVDSNPNSEFFKVNQLKYRKKMIKFARSRIHGWGLYALEPIAPDDMIVEYIGQKIRPIIADEREKAYERRGIGSSYLFRIDEDEVIDATRQGNFARFINHSCQPNCYAKVVTVDGDKRIVIYSKSLIQKGDEITYDYKFPLEENKIECLCGAPSCRGTLN